MGRDIIIGALVGILTVAGFVYGAERCEAATLASGMDERAEGGHLELPSESPPSDRFDRPLRPGSAPLGPLPAQS